MTNSSKKVQLTKEQASQLATFIFHYGATKAVDQAHHINAFGEPYDSLNRLPWHFVQRAVEEGWEVEPEPSDFMVGDVVVTPNGHVVLLVRDHGGSEYYSKVLYSADYSVGENGRVDLKKGNIRKATSSEVFFARMGRREYDFREGDIFVDEEREFHEVAEKPSYETITSADAIRWFDEGDCAGVIPVGSLVTYEGGAK